MNNKLHNTSITSHHWWVHKTPALLTLNLLTTTIVAPPSNASKWQTGFNSAFKELSPMLKLSLETSYCCWDSLQFSSVPPHKCTSTSSPIHFSLIICHSLLYVPGYWQHYPIQHKGRWLLNERSHFTWHSSNFKLGKITFVSALIKQNAMRTCEEAIV
jgi:hypothetical protein